jgi:hypothetical protein
MRCHLMMNGWPLSRLPEFFPGLRRLVLDRNHTPEQHVNLAPLTLLTELDSGEQDDVAFFNLPVTLMSLVTGPENERDSLRNLTALRKLDTSASLVLDLSYPHLEANLETLYVNDVGLPLQHRMLTRGRKLHTFGVIGAELFLPGNSTREFGNIRQLSLHWIGDERGVVRSENIRPLANLVALKLHNCDLFADALSVAPPTLQRLYLHDVASGRRNPIVLPTNLTVLQCENVRGMTTGELARLTQLRELYLTKVDDIDADVLASALPNLQVFKPTRYMRGDVVALRKRGVTVLDVDWDPAVDQWAPPGLVSQFSSYGAADEFRF